MQLLMGVELCQWSKMGGDYCDWLESIEKWEFNWWLESSWWPWMGTGGRVLGKRELLADISHTVTE
jgi:hypothetical protein